MHRSTRPSRTFPRSLGVLIVLVLVLALGSPGWGAMAQDATPTSDSPFFVQEDFERQLAQRSIAAEGPADQPWIQAIEPEYVDTAEYATEGPWKLCFSNASVNNPWRVTGFTTMQEEVKLHPEIGEFVVVDAEAEDNKQISDISDLLGQGCSALIVSPNTTAALTPAVEEACGQIPVIVFDRGVNTDCPVTFIHPIGGYAFGADAAEFLVEEVPEGGNILALRILPGVDVLETRWAAADIIFQQNNMNVVGTEFSEGDRANVKQIVSDYIDRFGQIDGIWMDAGQDAVAAIEAFEDRGLEVPPITGEDQQDFLQKWSDDSLTAVAPTYSNFQWRTPIIAATMILSGEQVPSEWVLPQPLITSENLADYLQPDMPPQHYALCGCENMEGFPEVWQNR
ncbi:MAG: substrate-binding domain-containing protein [Chloroflexia bacterium]|nr:substrate-binding domain-containing protein [Chloroflexia bacterium]